MKNIVFVAIVFSLLSSYSAFAGGPGDFAPTIKKQANAMGTALKKKDYKTYIKYIDPRVVKQMNGEQAFEDTLKRYDAQRAHYGSSIFDISVGQPTWVIDTARELQVSLPVTTQIRVKGGTVTSITTMIGISNDKGLDWVFLDTNEGLKSLRAKYKDLSSKLLIPEPIRPTFSGN